MRTQSPQLFPADRMHTRHAILDAAHMHEPVCKVDLIPGECAQFGNAEPVSIRDQDHQRIARAVAVALACRLDQLLHFARREVLARPTL